MEKKQNLQSVAVISKLFGKETAKRVILRHMYGV